MDLMDDDFGNPLKCSLENLQLMNNPFPLGTAEPKERISESATKQKQTNVTSDNETSKTKNCTCGGMSHKRAVILEEAEGILTYDDLYQQMSIFGKVEKTKINYRFDTNSSTIYVTYNCHCFAKTAQQELPTSNFNSKHKYKTLRIIDAIPTMNREKIYYKPEKQEQNSTQKKYPKFYWFITLKNNKNLIRAHTFLEKNIGPLEDNQLKRYSGGLLLRAYDETQAAMIPLVKLENSNIEKITEHRTFNNSRGVLYSKDLIEFTETELKELLPDSVQETRRIPDKNILILTFKTATAPTELKIANRIMKVKNYIEKPRQCNICYDYQHPTKYCTNQKMCKNCARVMNKEHSHSESACTEDTKCINCDQPHQATSKNCPRFTLEQKVLEKSHTEKITPALARRKLLGEETYQQVLLTNTKSTSQQLNPNPKTFKTNGFTVNQQPMQKLIAPIKQTTHPTKEPKDRNGRNKSTAHLTTSTNSNPNKQKSLPEITQKESTEEDTRNTTTQYSPHRCFKCNTTYNSENCLKLHSENFHAYGTWLKNPTYRAQYKLKDHRCEDDNCQNLYHYKNEDTNMSTYIDDNNMAYNTVSMFRKCLSYSTLKSEADWTNNIGKKRITCQKCNSEYKQLECLNKHNLMWHTEQSFVNATRPREHRCSWSGDCTNLIEQKLNDDQRIFVGSDKRHYRGVKEFRNGHSYNPNELTQENNKDPSTPSSSKMIFDPNIYRMTVVQEESIKRRRSLSNSKEYTEDEGKKPRIRHMSGGSLNTKIRSPEIYKLNQTTEPQHLSSKVADIAKRFSRKDTEQDLKSQRSNHKSKMIENKSTRDKPYSPGNPRKDNIQSKPIWR